MSGGAVTIDLAKPATVLIEKISDAIGVVFEPHRIIRRAKAEAEAEKIRTLAKIEVTDIQQRAMNRLAYEEGIRQENIEKITIGAIGLLGNDSQPESLDPDWLRHFFEKARIVSDVEMQSLWSKVLAGETTRPGSYSKRTIETVSCLDKKDALLFTQLCSFVIHTGEFAHPFIWPLSAPVYANAGLHFTALAHLDSIGLIRFDSNETFANYKLPQRVTVRYFEKHMLVSLSGAGPEHLMHLGAAILTESGRQLAPISGAEPNPDFPQHFASQLMRGTVALEVTTM